MYYKVVRRSDNGEYISCSTEGRWQLKYEIGVETVASVGGIYLFEDLQEAIDFVHRGEFFDVFSILEVEIQNGHYATTMCWSCDEDALDEYYAGGSHWDVAPPWASLVVAEKVIPRRVLDVTGV